MELDELEVLQRGACVIREGVAIAGVFPAVAGDPVRAAQTTGGHDDGPGAKHLEPPALAVVRDGARDATGVEEQRDDRVLHVHVEAAVDAGVLKRANQLQARAVADVREARIAMAAEVPLEDPAVRCAIPDRAPRFQLANALGRFLRMELGHAPVVEVLPAAHGIGEMHAPAVAVVHVGERRRHAALGHDGVRLAQERLRDHGDLGAFGRSRDGRSQSGTSGSNDQDVVIENGIVHALSPEP